MKKLNFSIQMRYFLLFIMFFTLTSVFSNNDSGNYVLKNNGEKVLIHPAFFRLDQANEFIIYKESAIAKEVKLKFSEFKYVVIKNLKFVTINFGRANGYQGFFVLCENSIHSLVFKVEDLSESSKIKSYHFYILDQNNTIVEEHKFDNALSNKSISQRNDIFGKINFFFNSCTDFAKRLVALENSEPESNSLSILELFEQPMFYDCK
ncbi:hypothetical protein [Flavobacterium sp. TSSA_36]|uniref:hypothetical protein n=1 Tax=Flavobacterium sp. TSSA_36 TaxID=3447669 RepID=UPI003F397B3D